MTCAPQRIPARWLHLFTFALTILAVDGMSRMHLPELLAMACVCFQAWDLSRNAGLQPIWPFCEWTRKPSEHLRRFASRREAITDANRFRVSGLPFPFFTGYLLGWRTLGYTGGFSLRKLCEFRGVTDPNGESAHDRLPERHNEYGVKYVLKNNRLEENESVCKPHPGNILEELECLTQRL